MTGPSLRLAGLPLPAKIMLTPFLALIGFGYFVALLNIYYHHRDADIEPGLSFNDLRRVYHGLDKRVTGETHVHVPSNMEKMIAPGGAMRPNLEKGGERAVRALTAWLGRGSKEAEFAWPGLLEPGDPSALQVIAAQCIRCHNSTDGENPDVPYAKSAADTPDLALVTKEAASETGPTQTETKTIHLPPTDTARLVQITHVHILAMPTFALLVGGLFLLTGLPARLKLVLGPAPMIAMCFDLGSWWMSRPFEPFVYVLAAAGAVFGLTIGAQILCIFASLWFGKRPA